MSSVFKLYNTPLRNICCYYSHFSEEKNEGTGRLMNLPRVKGLVSVRAGTQTPVTSYPCPGN